MGIVESVGKTPAIEERMTTAISALALLVSALSLLVSWRVWRSNARLQEPLAWLTFEGFEEQTEWWLATIHIRNRSPVGIHLDTVIAKAPTRLSEYQGPVIGGERWQFDDFVRDASLVSTVPLGDQWIRVFTGEEGDAGVIIRSPSREVSLQVVGQTIEANPRPVRILVTSKVREDV